MFEDYFFRNPGLVDFGLKEGNHENVCSEIQMKNVAEYSGHTSRFVCPV